MQTVYNAELVRREAAVSRNATDLLQLEVERQPAMTIVHCKGKVLFDSWTEFSVRVRELIPEGKPIRVDLANVTQVDSSGIGAFVSVWVAASKNGCDLKFRNANRRIADLVEITKLQHIFEEHG